MEYRVKNLTTLHEDAIIKEKEREKA